MTRRYVALLPALLLVLLLPTSAQATGYRYWSFWTRTATHWTYAPQGPSTDRPSDGDVQGFRFSVSEDSSDAATPRGTADFATICAKTPARDGRKRVALLIDFGTRADAPSGETPPPTRTTCAQVSPDATTADALAAVTKPLRYDTNALLCAIAGYPEKGCGEQVAAGKKTRTAAKEGEKKGSDGPSVGLWTGVAVVAVLGAAAVWQARRRRHVR
ncbi:SCO2322 family protein [Streptomyces gilvus]|uniref:SCO2322 family protein n=1 Tax=Streptomyces gilvus TaxID=2920937 RepID=UPI001F0F5B54|nr:SCO2322 family protein [Streptomyces sp. CME 23]MCH5676242.1 SCO2322 family protein [Streptomyces sp. CME 23]